jgi:probable addiction module antidote protein
MKVKLSKFDPVDYLDTNEAIQYFLDSALETNDVEYIIKALSVAMRAQGMLKVSKKTGLNRSGLYHSFYKSGNNPGILTVSKVADTLGYQLSLIPKTNSRLTAA